MLFGICYKNIVFCNSLILTAKVLLFFDMTKFICFFLQKSFFICICQKIVVILQSRS